MKTAKFSNGYTDAYKGRRPVTAAWMITNLEGVVLDSGHSIDRQTAEKTALLAFFGAVLFIISDSILALNRFREPFAVARVLNLSTYFAAQWLIAFSISKKENETAS